MGLEIPVRNSDGAEVRLRPLSEKIFDVPVSYPLVSQAVRYYWWNSQPSSGHTKTRGEVKGTGRKPWRQKGTGRARQGSFQAPQWVGGGVVFGPRPGARRILRLNKKMRRKAYFIVLSQLLRNHQILCLQDFDYPKPNTQNAYSFLKTLGVAGRRVLFVTPARDSSFLRSIRNVPGVSFTSPHRLYLLDLLHSDYLIFTESALDALEEVWKK